MSHTTTAPRRQVGAQLGAEIITVGDLARQVVTAELLLEQLQLLTQIPTDWARDLPDRVAQASWGVQGVTVAAADAADAADDLTALGEAVGALRAAIADAAAAGEVAAAARAHGQAEGLTRD